MAIKGTSKRLSEDHENWVANMFSGKRSKSSGAADHDAGDVRTDNLLIECKATRQERLPVFVQQLEKAALEAWAEGREPVLALRYYAPDSILAGTGGWIDLCVMRAVDAVSREEVFVQWQ